MMVSHGRINKDGFLEKKGDAVVKFFKHDGYAVPVDDLDKVKGVLLHTRYDGILFASADCFRTYGIRNDFNGEEQLVLPVKYWDKTTQERLL